MKYSEVSDVLKPMITECQNLDFQLSVIFKVTSEKGKPINGEFVVNFTCDMVRRGKFISGHVFKLDLDHIRKLLEVKKNEGITLLPDFEKIEHIQRFADEIGVKYMEVKPWLYCHNGTADNYQEIINFIIRRKASMFGIDYGL